MPDKQKRSLSGTQRPFYTAHVPRSSEPAQRLNTRCRSSAWSEETPGRFEPRVLRHTSLLGNAVTSRSQTSEDSRQRRET